MLDVDCAVESSVPWLMTLKGRLATVVPFWFARIVSTSAAALFRRSVDLAWTSSSLNDGRLAGQLVLHRGVGGDHDAVLVRGPRGALLGEHADDLEARRAELDRLAERVLPGREEVAEHRLADQDDAAAVA